MFYVYLIDKIWNLVGKIDPEHQPGIYVLYILALTILKKIYIHNICSIIQYGSSCNVLRQKMDTYDAIPSS